MLQSKICCHFCMHLRSLAVTGRFWGHLDKYSKGTKQLYKVSCATLANRQCMVLVVLNPSSGVPRLASACTALSAVAAYTAHMCGPFCMREVRRGYQSTWGENIDRGKTSMSSFSFCKRVCHLHCKFGMLSVCLWCLLLHNSYHLAIQPHHCNEIAFFPLLYSPTFSSFTPEDKRWFL